MPLTSTRQRVHLREAGDLKEIDDASVDLVVSSPPYPMIEMWDAAYSAADPAIAAALASEDGAEAFERMHRELDRVWSACWRVLRPGGIACLNIGDATRKVGGEFRLWSNHARVLRALEQRGFSILPDILWRKPTNAPNKFLGSGMLPAGAYVTYEHEYVLIARKGPLRAFRAEREKERRRRSAFFWEERNLWFSDVWTGLTGASQPVGDPEARARSAAFPFELAYRLVQMHSLIGDVVLDPFLGTGTTLAAALASGRSGIGYEKDETLARTIEASLWAGAEFGGRRARERLEAHRAFVAARRAAGKDFKYENTPHGVPVITRQETALTLLAPVEVNAVGELLFEAKLDLVAPAREPRAGGEGP